MPGPPLLRRWTRPALFAGGGLAMGLFFLREILFRGPYRPPEPAPAGIVDLHVHTAGIGAGNSGCQVAPALRQSYKFRIYLKAFGTSLAELEAKGDAVVIERVAAMVGASTHVQAAVVLALDGVIDGNGALDPVRTEIHVPNAFVAREVARHPRLRFGASVNPHRTNALELLDTVAAQGAVLVKWIPSVMDIDPADPRWEPFYRRLVRHGLPLLSHAGRERSFTWSRDELADPERLRLPLSLGVTVIAAHVAAGGENGGERDFERLARLMREFPNLYADVSALTQVNRLGWLREALSRPEMAGRLVYGSDFPLMNTALVSPWYYPLNLTRARMAELETIGNPWDRDVRLKEALGVPAEVFTRGAGLLGAAKKPEPRPVLVQVPGRNAIPVEPAGFPDGWRRN